MSDYFVAAIVEGQGDVQAVPILLQRIFQEARPGARLQMRSLIRVRASKFLQDTFEFTRNVTLAAREAKAYPQGLVLILLDCEDDCPATLGPDVLAKAQAVRSDVPIIVALAYREYETWFMAAARSLRGVGGLPQTMEVPPDPERTRDAKGWVSIQLGVPYNPPNHQPLFTQHFDFQQASTIPSFARLHSKLRQFFSATVF